MTKEDLARWRSLGFEFDAFFDTIAKDKPIEEVKILTVVAKQNPKDNDSEQSYTVNIGLTTMLNNATRLEVALDGKQYQAYTNFDTIEGLQNYTAVVTITLPIPFVEKKYPLTASLVDVATRKVVDLKMIEVEVKVVEDEKPNEDENMKNLKGCGIEFRNLVKCTKYKQNYGPVVWGNLKMSEFSKWDNLIDSNKVTVNEKNIVIAMSENEGNLDAINGYDNQIVSIGAMQKTVNQQGYGELPIQIWEFGLEYPEKYKSLLLNCGWKVDEEIENENGKEVVNYKIYYNGISENQLFKKIRNGFSKENYKEKVQCIPIEPLIKLVKDIDFQGKQIEDFIDRMNQSLQKKPKGYSYKISDFIISNLGKALVLDNDVNRPGQTKNCFGESLDTFFKKNSKVAKNPNEWKENHSKYETEVLEIYGPLRGEKKYTMTDAKGRFNKLKTKLL